MHNKCVAAMAFVLGVLVMVFALTLPSHGIEFGSFQGIKPVDLSEASMHFVHYVDGGMDPILYPESHHESLDVRLNIDFFRYIYWNNVILSETTTDQYRMVGLDTELGLRLTPFLNVFFHHQSDHTLDRLENFPHFPVYDGFGVTLFLYRRDPAEPSIIK